YLAGVGVGRGYLKEPERTAERFLPDPYSQLEGQRMYKTGDRVRMLADGNIEFLGRTDHLVKMRGYRIELGEIEAILAQHTGVHESVVVAQEGERAHKRLVAYVVPKEATTLTSEELRKYLQDKLPGYMLPSHLMVLEELPLTPNGKVDRRALPMPDTSRVEYDEETMKARTPIEEVVAGVWSEVLELEQLDTHENFFEIGGHSLLATQVIARLRSVLRVELPLRSLFEAPTVAQLAARVEQALRSEQGVNAPPLVPVSREQELPLSFAQQRLWFLDQLEPGNAAYTMPLAVKLQGQLEVAALQQSVQEVVRRHESLRTSFVAQAGRPVQVISAALTMALPVVDLQSVSEYKRLPEAFRLTGEEARQPFDLSRCPLLRVKLLRLSQQEHVLLLSMHHIIADAWSLDVFVREVSMLYEAFAQGRPVPLPPLSLQYADFAVWQRNWLEGEVLKAHIDYWKKALRGASPLELPTDRPRPSVQSYRGASHSFALPADLSQALKTLSRQEGVTLFMTLLAAFQTLLARYTGRTDVVVGTDIANRTHLETEPLIGFFVNLLALRTDLSGNPAFRKVMYRVREMVLGAYAHQDVPFEMLVENLRLERRLNQTPLVQILFVLQNVPPSRSGLLDVTLKPFKAETTTAKFDLAVFLFEEPEGLRGTVNYSTDLFEADTIATMMSRF
ncbi:MAG TPA: condensation domain-containing protein, partial [Ktedonobacteraceae bacterium]|nr:condensation domain-containing protein [Ktedonobacteraceae bacterium]